MTATERQVRLTAQLYEARDAAKRLLGPRYAQVMAELGKALTDLSTAQDSNPLSVAITCAKGVTGFDQLYLLAAAVELVEPS